MNPGHIYFLSNTTPGGIIDTAPGNFSPTIVQVLGTALNATTMFVSIQPAIERPTE
jgi:hypothetical protein